MEVYRVPVAVAAKIMGIGEQKLRTVLKRGVLPDYFGFAAERSYYISPAGLMKYTGCTEKDIKDAMRGESNV